MKKVTKTASVKNPIPTDNPTAIAKNTQEISLESPGRLRKRTKEKTPAIENALATFVPTNTITTETIQGKRASVIVKRTEYASPFFLPLIR